MTHYRISIGVNVYDSEALYAEAVKAYVGTDASAEKHAAAIDWLGTAESPNITNCLLELWAEYAPATAGYEFHTWDDALATD